MGRKFGQMAALAAALLLAGCQSPQFAVSALPSSPVFPDRSAIAQNAEVSTPMPGGSATDAPSGYLAFCARQPAECADPPGASDTVPFNLAMWQTLQQVNTAYNAAIRPQADSVHYGRIDYWTIPTDGYGDCEDYALAKRKALIAANLSPRALRIAVAQSRQGEPHAVLTVATDRGDYVLDSYQMSDNDNRAVRNLIHASGSVEEAQMEIAHWFKPEEVIDYRVIHEEILYDVNLDGILE